MGNMTAVTQASSMKIKKKMKNNRRILILSPGFCTDCEKVAERQTPNARIVQVFHLCSQRVCFRLSS